MLRTLGVTIIGFVVFILLAGLLGFLRMCVLRSGYAGVGDESAVAAILQIAIPMLGACVFVGAFARHLPWVGGLSVYTLYVLGSIVVIPSYWRFLAEERRLASGLVLLAVSLLAACAGTYVGTRLAARKTTPVSTL